MRYKVNILPACKDSIYEEREEGRTHSSFELEYILYNAIKAGDKDTVNETIDEYLNLGIVMGNLSSSPIRQARYWAIACISIAIHYAILGGLDETDAHNTSDVYIRHIDSLNDINEIIDYLKKKAPELTEAVLTAKYNNYSKTISSCVHYIHVHLHERLRIEDIAKNLGLSRDYLSKLFKKEVGVSLHNYILNAKLEEAVRLLEKGTPVNQISYTLSFSSESHFITCFKKKYGTTPTLWNHSQQD